MRKYKFLIISLILILFSTNMAFADENFISMETAATKAIERATSLKKLDNSLIVLSRQKKDAEKLSKEMENRVLTDSSLKDSMLKNYNSLSPQEKFQVNMLMMFRVIMTNDDIYSTKKAQYLSPMNAYYYYNLNRSSKQVAENQIKLAVYEQFNNLLKVQDAIGIENKLIDNLQKNYSIASTKLKAGKISKLDYQSIEINLKKENLNLQKLQRNLDTAALYLNQTTGEPVTKKYKEYTNNNVSPKKEIDSYDTYLGNALKNRQEIKSSSEYYEIKKKEHEIANELFPLESNENNYDTKYYMDEALDKLEKAKIDIELEIMNNYKELEKEMSDWENAEETYKQALDTYNEASKKYSLGFLSERQLSEINISLSQADMQLQGIKRDVWLLQTKMEYSTDIGPGISQNNSSLGGSK